jgi:hypothetical protein
MKLEGIQMFKSVTIDIYPHIATRPDLLLPSNATQIFPSSNASIAKTSLKVKIKLPTSRIDQ